MQDNSETLNNALPPIRGDIREQILGLLVTQRIDLENVVHRQETIQRVADGPQHGPQPFPPYDRRVLDAPNEDDGWENPLKQPQSTLWVDGIGFARTPIIASVEREN